MRLLIPGKLASLMLILVLSSGVQAEVYHCVNAHGEPKYQDKPCLDGEQSEVLELHPEKQPTVVNTDQAPATEVNHNRVQNAHFDHDLQFWTSRRDARR